MIRTIPWPADLTPPGGAATDVWQPPPFVTILGDPADLYVCSDAALSDTHGEEGRPSALRDYWLRDLHNAVVTGSTAPRVPLSAETLAELDRVHVAGSTSHIHLGDLHDPR